MNKAAAKHTPERHRWTVQLVEFRCKDEHQRRAVDGLGIMAHEVVRIWLQVVTPGAIVHEPPATPVRTAVFLSRAAARRFITTFGGKLLSAG